MDKLERIEFIKKFLHDNQNLSSYQASEKLEEHGIFIIARSVAKYREKYNIPFKRQSPIYDRIKADFDNGVEFGTPDEMAKKYGCSSSHARHTLRDLRGLKPVKRVIVEDEPVKVVTLEPVRVNTMQHAVMQLMQKCA